MTYSDNREAVYRREKATSSRLFKDLLKFNDALKFIENIITAGHVEKVPFTK